MRFDSRVQGIMIADMLFMLLDTNVYSRRYWAHACSADATAAAAAAPAAGSQSTAVHAQQLHLQLQAHQQKPQQQKSQRPPQFAENMRWGGSTERPTPRSSFAAAGSMELIANPTMSAAYAAHVEASLCYESYKFLADSLVYRNTPFGDDIDEQVACCNRLAMLCYNVASSSSSAQR
jgi:hypothetical protein